MGLVMSLYRKFTIKRYDDNHIIHYFSYKDFEGLEAEPVSFKTSDGITLKGYIYNYDGYSHRDDLVVFCHGIGGGHRSYMREIELLCRNGYQVISYDNRGCFESEGADIGSITEAVTDLLACLSFIDSREDLRSRRLSLIGHSWGGFAVGNICNFTDRPFHSITILSGPVDIHHMFTMTYGGKAKVMAPFLMSIERKVNRAIADSCSVDALMKTKARVLAIHSNDDPTVDIRGGMGYLRDHIPASETRVKYMEVTGKLHNPNYTADAVAYLCETFGTYASLLKSKKLVSFEDQKNYMDQKDWMRMTEQDPEVWNAIFENLS